MFRSFGLQCLTGICALSLASSVFATETTSSTGERSDVIPPLDTFKTMADDLKPEGWISFQNLADKQVVSFAPLMSLRCRLKEIRYSVDSKDLDESFPVPKCNREYPFHVEPQGLERPYDIEYRVDTVQALAVQLSWDDGSKSKIAYYEPCPAVGTAPCAYLVGSRE
ncbi:hypothetical protein PsAD2_01036 [Pseudovibrio axinellae]|uniref:Uncharacterized protein n=1 Tax=Pseudovibrio axinellae TaxID=989403 RepID=A0A161V808_9HYPH|nr:hypothetical protein [Pseudovibrio axinellae]KZL21044.1 hypothetical protein PsAD2_01036 [Pseudovibrio axinellae]SEP77718.1 hypothetical protein SAMN05421798_101365 [Pseudovibrio axinellae]